jgi:transcription initiation factor TFIIH subunit 4
MAGGAREIKSHALIEFLQSQTQNVLHRLYTRPSACLAILRLVNPTGLT